MTHALCPRCSLRFRPAAAALHEACPACGEPLVRDGSAQDAIGCRLFADGPVTGTLPLALTAALTDPDAGPS